MGYRTENGGFSALAAHFVNLKLAQKRLEDELVRMERRIIEAYPDGQRFTGTGDDEGLNLTLTCTGDSTHISGARLKELMPGEAWEEVSANAHRRTDEDLVSDMSFSVAERLVSGSPKASAARGEDSLRTFVMRAAVTERLGEAKYSLRVTRREVKVKKA